jgi:hypothetical protein
LTGCLIDVFIARVKGYMIQFIGTIIVAGCFFNSARITGKSRVKWMFIGAGVFVTTGLLLSYSFFTFVFPALLSNVIEASYEGKPYPDMLWVLISAGLLSLQVSIVVLIHRRYLSRKAQRKENT